MEIHGGSKNENLIDFSISVNPFTPGWIDAMFERCKSITRRYTYVEWIEDEFRQKFDRDAVIVAGATEAFQIIGFTLMREANVITPSPSYGEYERVASYNARQIHKIPPKNIVELDLEKIHKVATESVKNNRTILILGNPNNPTGKYLHLKDMVTDLANRGVIVIVDEAFVDFVDDSKREKISHPNVIRLRTFTKSYGMPGIRVGYVISENFKGLFERYRSPWVIGGCGYAFLEFLLKDDGKFLKESTEIIRKEAKRFEKIGMRTDANFGILKFKDPKSFQKKLDVIGIHVRNCESFGLKDRIRISIRTPKENDKLFETLERRIR